MLLNKKAIRFSLVLLAASLLFAGYFFSNIFSLHGNEIVKIKVAAHTLRAEVVDTDEKRKIGLGGRRGICDSCGMLFVFDKEGRYQFWMKNMFFPIDLVWINGDKVVDITPNVTHKDQEKRYLSSADVSYVLELPAGTCEKRGIEIGASVVRE